MLKFFDSYRFMQDSLSNLVGNLSEINNKDTMITSLTQYINKISQFDKKEPENKFVDNMRSRITSLTESIDKISQIDKKIAQFDKK